MLKRFCVGMAAAVLFLGILALQPGSKVNASKKVELIISAAVSLQSSLGELEQRFEAERSDIDLIFNFGSSGMLQRQIEQGASADLFLSAGMPQMEALQSEKLLTAYKYIMKNRLVMIVPSDSTIELTNVEQLLQDDIRKIAIGQPETVPAGSYAKQSLLFAKVWHRLRDKWVYAKDVRQVMAYVETGNAEAGFVYRTDAANSTKVKIAVQVSEDSHEPIIYPAGLLAESKHPKEAKIFYDYLSSSEALQIFRKHGFEQP